MEGAREGKGRDGLDPEMAAAIERTNAALKARKLERQREATEREHRRAEARSRRRKAFDDALAALRGLVEARERTGAPSDGDWRAAADALAALDALPPPDET